jgi:hypothetical protein
MSRANRQVRPVEDFKRFERNSIQPVGWARTAAGNQQHWADVLKQHTEALCSGDH